MSASPAILRWDAAFERYRSLALPLAVAAGASLLLGMFLQLGGEVTEGETRDFDTWFLVAAQTFRVAHPWFAEVMRDLSGLGSVAVLTLATVAACGYLVLIRFFTTAGIVLSSVATATAAVELLKVFFGRPRPGSDFAQFAAAGLSFPSGHSSMAAVVFMTLGALLARMHDRRRERGYIMGFAALLTLLVGVSRAALGVHWATDVLGGWAFGSGWALLWLLVASRVDA